MRKVMLISLVVIVFYTRFVGLSWGLPYPMHPDERNMSVALQQLNCKEFSIFPSASLRAGNFQFSNLRNCFNPQFFAYGQFPLYLGYFFVQFWHLLTGRLEQEIAFVEATMSLRLISAIASILNAFIILKIINLLQNPILKFKKQNLNLQFKIQNYLDQITNNQSLIILLIITFFPFFIQFSHFGTTESLLMLFYMLILYLSLEVLVKYLTNTSIFYLSLLTGLAIATKISSVIFVTVPLVIILWVCFTNKKRNVFQNTKYFILNTLYFLFFSVVIAILFSPHNFINWQEFFGSMRYESAVGSGAIKVFYTQQFENTIPVLFQLEKVFPYALGWPMYVLAILGFLFLSWKDKRINLMRFAFLIYFLPTSFLYAKWTRFMAPIFPIATIFAILFTITIYRYIVKLRFARSLALLGVTLIILPGLAYISIYQHPNIRFQASEWIYNNIPPNSYVLSETANVVDIPIQIPDRKATPIPDRFVPISFDFYNLDQNPELQYQLQQHLQKADYIFVPSRRLFADYSCEKVSGMEKEKCGDVQKKYPIVNNYYRNLFSGSYGFQKVAEFTSYPKIELFGKKLIEFPDEAAEETWTVFDHPVVRIYKKITLYKSSSIITQ